MSSYPGAEPIVCPLIITNKEDGRICEVAQKFTIGIEREESQNIPLVLELYKDEYCTEVIETDENGNYVSDDFVFSAGVEDTKTYYLRVKWPEDNKEQNLAFEIEYFSINVVSTQVD